MLFSCWFPVVLLAAKGLADTVGYWTLDNFQLLCDDEGVACVYRFSVSEDDTSGASGWQCLFTVNGNDGKPANQTDFHDMICLGNDKYKVNGGWSTDSPNNFVTIVVTNNIEDHYAFFAYQGTDLEEGKSVDSQTRLAYKVGTFAMDNSTDSSGKRDLTEWQVLGLQQRHDIPTETAELTFSIRDSQGSVKPCTIIVDEGSGDETAVGSFGEQKCIETDWSASWDYAVVDGSAMLTVVE